MSFILGRGNYFYTSSLFFAYLLATAKVLSGLNTVVMNKFCLILISLFFVNNTNAQLVSRYWNEDLNVKQDRYPFWKEMTIKIVESGPKGEKDYISSKTVVDDLGARVTTHFDENGSVETTLASHFTNDSTEVMTLNGGGQLVKTYDEYGNMVREYWDFNDGTTEEKRFKYRKGKLVQIFVDDEFGKSSEKLIYDGKKLIRIESYGRKKKPIMIQSFSYRDGLIVKMERIQKKKVNKTVSYYYNDTNHLIRKREKAINRITGKAMPPEIYVYTYYANGKLKEKKWTTYMDDSAKQIKYVYTDVFSERGLILEEAMKDNRDNSYSRKIYSYK